MSKVEWLRGETGQLTYPYKNGRLSKLAVYHRRRKNPGFYVVAPLYWYPIFSEDIVVSGPWPTRAAAKVALLIKLEAEGWS